MGTALPSAVAGLLPRLRKVKALKLALAAMPAELDNLAAPHEIRLAPSDSRSGELAPGQINTLFVYTATAAVSAILDQRANQLMGVINAGLPYPLVEAIRCEQASASKIAQQLNNLTLSPD